jgi:hypothetical protein
MASEFGDHIEIIEGENIILNLQKGIDVNMLIGRIIDPHLKKSSKSYMQINLKNKRGSVVYEIQWTSDRQRKAYFASDGFDGGIPTTRTGEHERNWFVKPNRRAGEIAMGNSSAQAEFTVGQFQQQFHKNTGYPLLSEHEQPWINSSVPVVAKAATSEINREINKK